MRPYYEKDGIVIWYGDCRDILPTLEPVDAIVTDPPYGLSFMGKDWDHGVPGEYFWKIILESLTPGAMCLAFGGTRTHHRLMVAIEDAGWELRDTLMWVYGSGFPKSLDVSKAIDKEAGAERKAIGERPWSNAKMEAGQGVSGLKQAGGFAGEYSDERIQIPITAPATDAAKEWGGWGTALKPAWEPIILARKPLEGTVAQNVLKYGTGALNIDGSRVGNAKDIPASPSKHGDIRTHGRYGKEDGSASGFNPNIGRWPANLIHDGSDEVVELFPDSKGGAFPVQRTSNDIYGGGKGTSLQQVGGPRRMNDMGSAARFFYCVKASKKDRGQGNNHPTVKPMELMEYLCRLVLRPGGTVLDPFMGSGSTLLAARSLGRKAIGIEIEEKYCEIAAKRVMAFGPEILHA